MDYNAKAQEAQSICTAHHIYWKITGGTHRKETTFVSCLLCMEYNNHHPTVCTFPSRHLYFTCTGSDTAHGTWIIPATTCAISTSTCKTGVPHSPPAIYLWVVTPWKYMLVNCYETNPATAPLLLYLHHSCCHYHNCSTIIHQERSSVSMAPNLQTNVQTNSCSLDYAPLFHCPPPLLHLPCHRSHLYIIWKRVEC